MRARVGRDLLGEHQARDVQRVLLPQVDPVVPGYRISGTNVPARIISGDYYDYIAVDEQHCGVVIADVSGKGVPASLIMAMCRSVLRQLGDGEGALIRLQANVRAQAADLVLWNGLNLERWFEKFFRSPEFMNALFLSLWVAGCVLVLSIVACVSGSGVLLNSSFVPEDPPTRYESFEIVMQDDESPTGERVLRGQ